jgi:hypothetical protein
MWIDLIKILARQSRRTTPLDVDFAGRCVCIAAALVSTSMLANVDVCNTR